MHTRCLVGIGHKIGMRNVQMGPIYFPKAAASPLALIVRCGIDMIGQLVGLFLLAEMPPDFHLRSGNRLSLFVHHPAAQRLFARQKFDGQSRWNRLLFLAFFGKRTTLLHITLGPQVHGHHIQKHSPIQVDSGLSRGICPQVFHLAINISLNASVLERLAGVLGQNRNFHGLRCFRIEAQFWIRLRRFFRLLGHFNWLCRCTGQIDRADHACHRDDRTGDSQPQRPAEQAVCCPSGTMDPFNALPQGCRAGHGHS